VSLDKRLERLEDASQHSAQSASRAALEALSDEELDVLEDTLEAAAGEGRFEDLYAATTERGRRTLDAYTYSLEAVKRGEVRMNSSKKGAEQ
jgi:hypothetical protein